MSNDDHSTMTTTKTSKKRAKTVRKRPRKKSKAATSSAGPSHIRGHVTASRGGRPTRLTHALIEQFLELLAEGLHVGHCAALTGLTHTQVTEYLRVGRRDADAKKRTIRAKFSILVREGIAALQQKELRTLADVERIALGFDPLCRACRGKLRGCGKHKPDIRLAADLAKWRLVHRHPKDWHVGTVSLDVTGNDDSPAMVPGSAGDEGGPKAAVAALVMYIPRRRDDLE